MRKNVDWEGLLGRAAAPAAMEQSGICHASHRNQCVLITGAGGSIGSELTMRLCRSEPGLLLLLEASEQKLYELDACLSRCGAFVPYVAVLGSVDDQDLLDELCSQHHPKMIYHTAAHKHVPLGEANPFAVIRNNTIATYGLVQTALRHRVGQVLMVSTDKAVHPSSIMGTSKRMAEMVLLACSNARTRMTCVRLGNVLGSQGSVVGVFLEQIARGDMLTVTHPDAQRFFFTMEETISLILEAGSHAQGRQVLIPQSFMPTKIVELANYLIKKSGSLVDGYPIVFTGLRPGEKLIEEFIGPGEGLGEGVGSCLHSLNGPVRQEEEIQRAMVDLDAAVRIRSLSSMLQVIKLLVPEYIPSAYFKEKYPASLVYPHA